jgi:hypothetical protein
MEEKFESQFGYDYTEQQTFDLQFKYHCLNCATVDDIFWDNGKTKFRKKLTTPIRIKMYGEGNIYSIRANRQYFTDVEFVKEFGDFINFNMYLNALYHNSKTFIQHEGLLDEVLKHFTKHSEYNMLVTKFDLTEEILEKYFKYFEPENIVEYQYDNISIEFCLKHFKKYPTDEEIITDKSFLDDMYLDKNKSHRVCVRHIYLEDNYTILLFWNPKTSDNEVYITNKYVQKEGAISEITRKFYF